MKIFTVEEAKKTILNRKALNRIEYSPLTIERTEAYFGKGVTPPQAVAIILDSIEAEGDAALLKWSKLLDRFEGGSILVPQEKMKEAWDNLPADIQKVLQQAADRIRAFHEKQPIQSWMSQDMGGKVGPALHGH